MIIIKLSKRVTASGATAARGFMTYELRQTKGPSLLETNITIGCQWTIFKNGSPIRVFDEYMEALSEYKKLRDSTY